MTTIREKALNALVFVDTVATYIPVVCVASAAFSAIFKKCVIDNLEIKTLINNSYFKHLNDKSYKRCGAEFFAGIFAPVISNIFFGIYDVVNWDKKRKNQLIDDLNRKADNGDEIAIRKLILHYTKKYKHTKGLDNVVLELKINMLKSKLPQPDLELA